MLLTCNWTAYVWAVAHDDIIQTALGYFIAPLGTVLIGVVVLGERLRPAQRLALGLAAVAVVELTVSYGRIPWLALPHRGLVVAVRPVQAPGPSRPVREPDGRDARPRPARARSCCWCPRPTATAWPPKPRGRRWCSFALTGVATTVPLVMFAGAARRVPFTLLGPMMYIVPSINFLLGTLVYHEAIDASQLLGFALVWAVWPSSRSTV